MLKAGIDTLAFYTSPYVLDLTCLAEKRGVNAEKFSVGLGQYKMSVPAPDEDIVTMGAYAAEAAIKEVDPNTIDMLLFATESGIDQSKSAGIYVHELLKLPERCRVLELKQACYSATGALQLALPFLRQYPDKKILLIASDIARYGLNTPGESSQGCGAAAMVLSVNPRLISFESEYGVAVESVMDFWRPNYADAAFVEGKYSSKLYLQMLEKTWEQYMQSSGRGFQAHDYFCYHSPVPRLVEKAHQYLAKLCSSSFSPERLQQQIQNPLEYNRLIGNSYTASLYIGLASLLDLTQDNLAGKRVGFYSYGSGCIAEFFSGVIQDSYKNKLNTIYHQKLLNARQPLSYEEYEEFYHFKYAQDGSTCEIPYYQNSPNYLAGKFRLAAIREHKRIYERV